MELKEKTLIHGNPDEVWAYLGDVKRWPEFVDKIRRVTPVSGGYLFDHVKGPMRGELLDGRIGKDIGVRISIEGKEAVFRYLLEESKEGCIVTEFQGFHIPFPFNLLVALIHRIGRKTGESNLEKLKRIVEAGRA
jgi:hypothetical protein